MKRLIAVISVAALATSLGTSEAQAAPKPKKFANCAALNDTYQRGSRHRRGSDRNRGRSALPAHDEQGRLQRERQTRPVTQRDSVRSRPAEVIPDAVQNLRVTNQSATGANLACDAPASNGHSPITSYVINGSAGSAAIAGTTAVITGLSAGTAYAFMVSTVNGIGTSDPAPVNVTRPAVPTPTPTSAAAALTAVKYANCTAAKAARVTPIRRDTNPSLYALNSGLDRDKDGIACD
jgi:hypothetical protein